MLKKSIVEVTMEAIREYFKVIDHKVNLSKEVSFDSNEVEVERKANISI